MESRLGKVMSGQLCDRTITDEIVFNDTASLEALVWWIHSRKDIRYPGRPGRYGP